MKKYSIITNATGEITEASDKLEKVIVKDQQVKKYSVRRAASYLKFKKIEKEKTINEMKFNEAVKNHCGNFHFNIYRNIIDKEYTFRYAYLCSLADYDNFIVWGNGKDRRANKKDLQEILMVSEKEYYRTVSYLEKNNMITIDEEGIVKLSETFYQRGSSKDERSLLGSTREFDEAIKELYKTSKARQHKKLDILIKMLPLINNEYNVICKNPMEKDPEKIDFYTLTELAKKFGYSTTQRFKSSLFDLKIKEEYVIAVVRINNVNMICINPKLFYKGRDYNKLVYLVDLFTMAKNNIKK